MLEQVKLEKFDIIDICIDENSIGVYEIISIDNEKVYGRLLETYIEDKANQKIIHKMMKEDVIYLIDTDRYYNNYGKNYDDETYEIIKNYNIELMTMDIRGEFDEFLCD